jgi:hypothetical protein
MAFVKVTTEYVIDEEGFDILDRALSDAMEKIADRINVYATDTATTATSEPEDAAKFAAYRA